MGLHSTAATPHLAIADLVAMATAILRAAGTSEPNAAIVADHLAEAQAMGHASHGLRLLDTYVDRLLGGKVSGTASPAILQDAGAIMRVSGNMAFGQVVGEFAAGLGVMRAKEHGICLMAVKDSAQFGRNGRWPEYAARRGVASIHFAHGVGASVVPFGARDPKLGTNPIAMGVPGPNGEDLILDFAVSELAGNAVKLAFERGEMLASAALMGPDGPTNDPAVMLAGKGGLLPFGGFKGYGLAVFGEIFGGVIVAGERKANGINSMLSIYFDPLRFTEPEIYDAELSRLITNIRSARPVESDTAVSVPGDRSRAAHRKSMESGVVLTASDLATIMSAADKAGAAQQIRTSWPELF